MTFRLDPFKLRTFPVSFEVRLSIKALVLNQEEVTLQKKGQDEIDL